MERPEDRFRLNSAAKEHRLETVRHRLEKATPKKKKAVPRPTRNYPAPRWNIPWLQILTVWTVIAALLYFWKIR